MNTNIKVQLKHMMCAYAEISLDVPEGASPAEIVEKIREYKRTADYDECMFAEDWSTADSLEVLSAKQGDKTVLENAAIEVLPYKGGEALMKWLSGQDSFASMLEAAATAKLVGPIEMQSHCGSLKLPGAEAIEIDFECRKGATREEKDLAFIEALASIGTIEHHLMDVKQED